MTEIIRISRLELCFAPRPWPFADRHRGEIARHFETLKQTKPAVWNAAFLLCMIAVAGDLFRGAYPSRPTMQASSPGADWGFPDATVRNCFRSVPCAGPTAVSVLVGP